MMQRIATVAATVLLVPLGAAVPALADPAPAVVEADALLVRAADELHVDNVLSDATWAALADRYDTEQLIEIPMVVGQYHLVAFTLRSLGIQPEPGVASIPGRPA